MRKFGLLPKILIAIVLGIVCSLFFPMWAARIFETFNSIFSNFLGMFIPLLIIGLVAPAIADLGRGAGKLLLYTVLLAYLSTILAGFVSYFTCRWTFPSLLGGSIGVFDGFDTSNAVTPYFTVQMPAFINVVTALVFAFILGLGSAALPNQPLKGFLDDFRSIINITIKKFIIPCLPVFIYGIFLKMGVEGQVASVVGVFIKIIIVILVLHVGVLICQFLIAGAISGKNPFKALVTMLPAYATALGTQSSAATIPVTLDCTKKLGVRPEVAGFTIPLCATVHMPCSILKITACSFAVSFTMGTAIDLGTYAGFILMLAITMVAAPGVPGGAVMAALGVISSMLGFDANMQGLIIAIYIALDCFGTAGNVTGDGALSLIIDKIRGDRMDPVPQAESVIPAGE